MKYLKFTLLFVLILFASCTVKKSNKVLSIKEIDSSNEILFLSTQLNPNYEANIFRTIILKNFEDKVNFQPNDYNYIYKMMNFELDLNPEKSTLIGGSHGDILQLKKNNSLMDLTNKSQTLKNRNFIPELYKLGQFETNKNYYYPWMQATYLMMANKDALKYLPEETDLNNLTYNELILWGKNIKDQTGLSKIGFPAGEAGLMHRFLQGYAYPSYTGNTLLKFRTDSAIKMWKDLKELWLYVSPESLLYSNMSIPLQKGDIWIAWDHVARLLPAIKEQPDDFIVFPAPIGPKGRGFISVVSGLSIPKDSINEKHAIELIEYLTSPQIQLLTLKEVGFYPVIELPQNLDIPKSLKLMYQAINYQSISKNSITTLLPLGLGERGSSFNSLYILAFTKIVLNNNDIKITINNVGERLQEIINEVGAPSWKPDFSTDIPCKLE